MTRTFVKSQLPKDVEGLDGIVDAIMTAHGEAVEREKGKAKDLQGKIEALQGQVKEAEESLNAALSDEGADKELAELTEKVEKLTSDEGADKKLAELKAQVEKLTADLKAEQEAHTTTKTGYESEKTNAALLEKIHAAAIKAGKLDGLGVKALKKHSIDMSTVKHKIDKDKNIEITNLDDILKGIQADDVIGDLWGGEIRIEGAGNGNPPPGSDGVKNPWLKNSEGKTGTIDEQTKIFRDNPDVAKEMMKAAGVS